MVADLGVAFIAGLLSCASACVLPLLPAFIAYLGGLSAHTLPPPGGGQGGGVARTDDTIPGVARSATGVVPPTPTVPLEGGGSKRLAPLGGAALFVAGFATTFVALGAGAAVAGASLAAYRPVLVTASGVVLVALGVALAAGVPWLAREWRFHVAHRLPRSPLAAYVVGVAFAAGWTPCVGPILAAILVLAANSGTAVRGAALLAAYSAGMGLPFLAAGAFVGPVTALLAKIRGAYPALSAAAAVLLIGMGVLTLTGRLTALNGFVPDLAPAAPPVGLSGPPPGAPPPGRLVGRQAPGVTVADVAGHRLRLDGLRGRPVVVNFWATWCVPCRQELPLFAAAAQAHRAEGLAVVPIDFQESPAAVERFWRDLGLDLTPYLDPDGSAARAYGVGLQQTGLPVTVLVDRHGVVRSLLPGQVDAQLFSTRIDQVLRE